MDKQRCDWCLKYEDYRNYHDEEWAVPQHNDISLFESLCLSGVQAGLSWWIVLSKRKHYREVFDNWDIQKIALYDDEKIQNLLEDKGLVRNKAKMHAIVGNAQKCLLIQQEFGSLNNYIWQFSDNKIIRNTNIANMAEIPTRSELSDSLSKDLKKRGFKFVGTTIIYAFLQAVGVIDDHLVYCWKHSSFQKKN